MLDTKPAPRTATPPAKTWRNYYRIYRVLHLGRMGPVFPGIHAGPDLFPSKDVAEQFASTLLAAVNPKGRFLMDYVAAFPEGDRAH